MKKRYSQIQTLAPKLINIVIRRLAIAILAYTNNKLIANG